MKLPRPPSDYSVQHESQRNLLIELDAQSNLKSNRDIEVGDGRLILASANGTRYALSVNNSGTISTVVV
jgi:hypothetical protein